MIVQCECGQRLKPRAGFDGKPGQKVILRCTCGQRLRFTVPDRPVGEGLGDIHGMFRNFFAERAR